MNVFWILVCFGSIIRTKLLSLSSSGRHRHRLVCRFLGCLLLICPQSTAVGNQDPFLSTASLEGVHYCLQICTDAEVKKLFLPLGF